MKKHLTTPLTKEKVISLKCGDSILLSGTIYTARDAAHKRLIESIEKGEELPFDLQDSIIFYVGPSPKKENQVIGSSGPTTSYRMDLYSPKLMELGNRGMIGKGKRNEEVIETMKKYKAVYFGAIGGAGAMYSECVEKADVIAYEDLGAEAIFRLEVHDFPLDVIIDCEGNNLYEKGPIEYLKSMQ